MIVQQATALLEGGADFIIFETQPTRGALERCAAAMRQLPDAALRAFAGRRGAMRIGLGRADRADAGAAARRNCPRRSPGE